MDWQSGPGPDIQPGDFVVFSESVANPHALVYRVATVGERVTAVTPQGGSITAPPSRFAAVPKPKNWRARFRADAAALVQAWAEQSQRRKRGG